MEGRACRGAKVELGERILIEGLVGLVAVGRHGGRWHSEIVLGWQ